MSYTKDFKELLQFFSNTDITSKKCDVNFKNNIYYCSFFVVKMKMMRREKKKKIISTFSIDPETLVVI